MSTRRTRLLLALLIMTAAGAGARAGTFPAASNLLTPQPRARTSSSGPWNFTQLTGVDGFLGVAASNGIEVTGLLLVFSLLLSESDGLQAHVVCRDSTQDFRVQ